MRGEQEGDRGDCGLNILNYMVVSAKTKRYLRESLKKGLRVEFEEKEGLFCKISNDVRPEALAGLLVGKDKDF